MAPSEPHAKLTQLGAAVKAFASELEGLYPSKSDCWKRGQSVPEVAAAWHSLTCRLPRRLPVIE